MKLLSVIDVTINYENVLAVDNVSFEVFNGDYLCIVGENGSGKSTLIKGILGLNKLKSGKILFHNDIRRNQIGYLPQQTIVQKDFPASVFEVVLSGCLNNNSFKLFFSKEDKRKVIYNLNKLSILSIKDKSYRDLSGGQQQRVLLARALCAAEKIIVLDEPVSGLVPVITDEFYSAIKKLNTEDGITVIMVSHDLKSAAAKANKILHLSGNRAEFFGSVTDYLKSEKSMMTYGRKQ